MVSDFEKYRKFNLRELQAAAKPEEASEPKAEEAKEEPKSVAQSEEKKAETLVEPVVEETKTEAAPAIAKTDEVSVGEN